jgi:hypothetical protein
VRECAGVSVDAGRRQQMRWSFHMLLEKRARIAKKVYPQPVSPVAADGLTRLCQCSSIHFSLIIFLAGYLYHGDKFSNLAKVSQHPFQHSNNFFACHEYCSQYRWCNCFIWFSFNQFV